MSKKSAIVTGITGQDGSYLAEHLLENDFKVYGIKRRTSGHDLGQAKHLEKESNVEIIESDLLDSAGLNKICKTVKPDHFYNLAAQSVHPSSLITIKSGVEIETIEISKLWDRLEAKYPVAIEMFKSDGVQTTSDGVTVKVIDIPEKEGIQVLTFESGMGVFRKLGQISKHFFEGKLIKLSQKWGTVILTPNHSAIDKYGRIFSPLEGREVLAARKIDIGQAPEVAVSFMEKKVGGEKLYQLSTLFCSYVSAKEIQGKTGSTTPNSEGAIDLYGIANELEKGCQWIEEITKEKLPLTVLERSGKNVLIRIESKAIAKELALLCSNGKKLPSSLIGIGNKQIFAYCIETLSKLLGDGEGINDIHSEELAVQLSIICGIIGKDFYIARKEKTYSIRFCDTYECGNLPENLMSVIDFSGDVYDLSVPQTNNFIIGPGNVVVHNSHVATSFEQPNYTLLANAQGTLNCLEAIRNSGVHTRFYHACHDTETTAYIVGKGFVPYSQIVPGDEVISLEEGTNRVVLDTVKEVLSYPYQENLLRIRGYEVDKLVTKNHRCLVTDTKTGGTFYISAEELVEKVGSKASLIVAKARKEFTYPRLIDIGEFIELDETTKGPVVMLATDLLYLCGIFFTIGTMREDVEITAIGTGILPEIKTGQSDTENEAGFLGVFVTAEKSRCASILTQVENKQSLEVKHKIRQIVNRAGITAEEISDRVQITSPEVTEFMEVFLGHLRRKKRLLETMVHEFSQTELLEFFRGIKDSHAFCEINRGENTLEVSIAAEESFTVSSNNKVAIESLSLVAIAAGLIPEITEDVTAERTNYILKISEPKGPEILASENFQEEPYSGTVWCLSVRNNKNFLIKRNGKLCFSGNSTSEMFGGQYGEVKCNEQTPFYPRSPYGCSKVYAHYLTQNYRDSYKMFACSGILFNHECFFGSMPVFVKDSLERITVRSIQSLYLKEQTGTQNYDNENISVWDGKNFVKLRAVSKKRLSSLENVEDQRRFMTHSKSGLILTTPNHKIIKTTELELQAKELNTSDKLVTGQLPKLTQLLEAERKQAEFAGLFLRAGELQGRYCIFCGGEESHNRLLELSKELLIDTEIVSVVSGKNPVSVATIKFPLELNYLKLEYFEEKTGLKRVPEKILNSSKDIQRLFLEAFFRRENLEKDSFTFRFSNYSPVLVQGLLWLMSEALVYRYTLCAQESTPSDITVIFEKISKVDSSLPDHGRDYVLLARKEEVEPEEKYVYDVETESGVVMAGIGNLVVGNSPRRGPNFVTRKITIGIAKILKGEMDKLFLGNLKAKRDWGHSKDYVRAMYMMLNHKEPQDFVIATGETHMIEEFCIIAFEYAGLGDYRKYVVIDPNLYRPAEVDILIGDYTKAKNLLGWEPQISFEELVKEMVDSDKRNLGL